MFALIVANKRLGNCDYSLMKLSNMRVPFVSECSMMVQPCRITQSALSEGYGITHQKPSVAP